jgi:hypothetical protein
MVHTITSQRRCFHTTAGHTDQFAAVTAKTVACEPALGQLKGTAWSGWGPPVLRVPCVDDRGDAPNNPAAAADRRGTQKKHKHHCQLNPPRATEVQANEVGYREGSLKESS